MFCKDGLVCICSACICMVVSCTYHVVRFKTHFSEMNPPNSWIKLYFTQRMHIGIIIHYSIFSEDEQHLFNHSMTCKKQQINVQRKPSLYNPMKPWASVIVNRTKRRMEPLPASVNQHKDVHKLTCNFAITYMYYQIVFHFWVVHLGATKTQASR